MYNDIIIDTILSDIIIPKKFPEIPGLIFLDVYTQYLSRTKNSTSASAVRIYKYCEVFSRGFYK